MVEGGRVRKAAATKLARKSREDARRVEVMVNSARLRAVAGGYPFSITTEHVRIPEFCPLLGLRLQRGVGSAGPASPSLDKMDPKLGYIPGNVWVVSQRANMLKSNATLHELQTLVANWFLYATRSV